MASLSTFVISHNRSVLTHHLMACVPAPYVLLVGSLQISVQSGYYDIACNNSNLINSITSHNYRLAIMILHQSSLVMLPINVTGRWYESTGLQILKEFNNLLCRGKHFLGLLIAGLVSLSDRHCHCYCFCYCSHTRSAHSSLC